MEWIMARNIDEALIAKIKDIVGENGFTQDQELIGPQLTEWRDKYFGNTPLMVMPKNTAEVQAIVRLANSESFALVTQGGNTGLVAGQIPFGEVLLSLKRMDKVRALNPNDDTIIAEAGVILQNVHDIAEEINRKFPVSLASQGSATIGGLISTNAGGVHVRRYGMMRNQVLGLEVVLPNGEIICELNSLRKDNTGYDLKHMFIGAEGTLGIITAACLRFVPKPKKMFAVMAGTNSPDDAIICLRRLENETGKVSAFEIMNETAFRFGLKNLNSAKNPMQNVYPFNVLIEFECSTEDEIEVCENALFALIEDELLIDAAISQNEAQFNAFWYLREGMSAAQKPEGKAAKHDISVPISKVSEFLIAGEKAAATIVPNVRIAAFGHISDGNIHYDVARPIDMADEEFSKYTMEISNVVNDVALSMGGAISAEHGIGVARRDEFLSREPEIQLEIMRNLKKMFDPKNILNPRVLL